LTDTLASNACNSLLPCNAYCLQVVQVFKSAMNTTGERKR
jgi:hypothetical protein